MRTKSQFPPLQQLCVALLGVDPVMPSRIDRGPFDIGALQVKFLVELGLVPTREVRHLQGTEGCPIANLLQVRADICGAASSWFKALYWHPNMRIRT